MPAKLAHGRNHVGGGNFSISATGARLRGLKGVQPGDRLILRLRRVELGARVVWFDSVLYGVQFARSVSEPEALL